MVTNYAVIQVNGARGEDADLVLAAQNGDLEAFNQLVLFYQDRIYGLAFRILGDKQSAEDITQLTFLKAYLRLHTFRRGLFRWWLGRVAVNACYDELRRRKHHPIQSLEVEDHGEERLFPHNDDLYRSTQPEVEYERREMEQAIRQALGCLNPEQRAVLQLVELQDVDYLEAAQILGVPIGTIKSRLARSRIRLREYFRTLEASKHEPVN